MTKRIDSIKYWWRMIIPSLTSLVFIGFAFLIASVIVLSIIPLYIGNRSVPKTRFILTTIQINNYVLQMNRSTKKRDLSYSSNNTKNLLTLNDAQSIMNSSIQYALEQQLNSGDHKDKFNISILQMVSSTSNLNSMSAVLDFLILYTRECMTCDTRRRLTVFKQLCSNNQLQRPIRFSIQSTNLSYIVSDPVIVYTPSIPIENLKILTRIASSSPSNDLTNIIQINQTTQISNKIYANNYTLIVSTSKTNYFATLDETDTHISANINDGPIPLIGASTMYAGLAQAIERQIRSVNGSNILNVTINQVILQFRYSNSTIQVIIDFLITFSTSCSSNCMNERSNQLMNQLDNFTNIQINIQPANLADGQVKILKNGNYILYNYSLTTQIIANFTGTIIQALSPTLIIIY